MTAREWEIVEGVKEYLHDMLEARADVVKFGKTGSISCHVGYGIRATEIYKYVRDEIAKGD